MSSPYDTPWWLPVETDHAWCEQMRKDYPSVVNLSDDAIRNKYARGCKYQITWDHVSDAYDQFERLADAYLALLKKPKAEHPVTSGKTIVTVEISATEDGVAHSQVACGQGRSFDEVLEGLRICEREIATQILNRNRCPFSPTNQNDPTDP